MLIFNDFIVFPYNHNLFNMISYHISKDKLILLSKIRHKLKALIKYIFWLLEGVNIIKYTIGGLIFIKM